MQVYLFLDLDDTLFQTRPKCPESGPLRPAAFRKDGTPLSFMTQRQGHLFELFDSTATIIPVTARNLDAFRRVDLPFRSLAVLDFGGVILLADGTPDPLWDARVRPQALAAGRELAGLRDRLASFIEGEGLEVSVRLIVDFDLPLYVVMKHARADSAVLERIRQEMLSGLNPGRFFVHANDNNLSVVPGFLGKEHAVQHILDTYLEPGPRLTLGMGDSLTDAPFVQLCDYVLVPAGCQLFHHTFSALGGPRANTSKKDR
jgi:hypothetical protein